MTRIQFAGILLALAALLGAFAIFTHPATAADPVCEYTYDEVAQQFADAGSPVVEVDPAKLPELVAEVERNTGQSHGDVTRAFIAQSGGRVLLGLEENGCLSPPIVVGFAGPAPAGRSA